MNNEILIKLKAFIIKEAAVDEDEVITRDTKVEDDLGVYGDDGDDFLIAFGKEFNVDVMQFPIGDYFSGEGDPILPAIIRMLTGRRSERGKCLQLDT